MRKKKFSSVQQIYEKLYQFYGPQGWWPLLEHGYHPGNYDYPQNTSEQFEIAVGAILTQNTSWLQVEKALSNLQQIAALTAQNLLKVENEKLLQAIRPAGYFNQKAKKLKIWAKFFISLRGKTPTREELLSLWGIGPETADSILLYAYHYPSFVIDAYTRRILGHLGLISEKSSYEEVKALCESSLPRDTVLFQEYHALFVEHAKRHYSRKPHGVNCPLSTEFKEA